MLESLYRRHAADVYRYALMMLDSPADAEDVTQTTFLNAYRALLRGERPRHTGSWLRTIAHNLCLQHFRQASRRPSEVELEDEAAELVSEHQAFVVEDLSRALGQIPVNQRAALLMRELEGRSIAEIATVLGVSKSAVETLLFRARRGVREQLEGALTCAEAEQAISRQLDGHLKRSERGALRAHLRQCEECAHLARSLRAQRGAIRALAAIPLPGALAWSKFGSGAAASSVASANVGAAASGGAWVAGTVVSKLAGAAVVAALGAGAGVVAVVDHPWRGDGPVAKVPVRVAASEGAASASPAASSASASSSTSPTRPDLQRASRAGQSARLASLARAGAAAKVNGSPAVKGAAPGAGPAASTGKQHGSAGSGASRGKHAGQGKHKPHPTHPAHPAHPTHPAKPTHPAQPTPPTHPVKPAHPATPSATTTTPTPTPTTTTKRPAPPANGSGK
jgi:RNA polymerase sigma factor (sigma-70 family)